MPKTLFLVGAFGLLFTASCSGGKDAADKQFGQMEEEITRLQAEQDRMSERMGELETKTVRPASAVPTGGTRPPLDVVVLRPDGDSQPGDDPDAAASDDNAPRTTVRATGRSDVGETSDGTRGRGAKADARSKAEAQKDYESALSMVKKKQYDKAIEALTGFLVRYPDDARSDNAMFWMGEAYLGKGDTSRALEQYQAVVSRFPDGNKAPDALLKIGVVSKKLGDDAKAKEAFATLKSRFPSSDAAHRAPKELGETIMRDDQTKKRIHLRIALPAVAAALSTFIAGSAFAQQNGDNSGSTAATPSTGSSGSGSGSGSGNSNGSSTGSGTSTGGVGLGPAGGNGATTTYYPPVGFPQPGSRSPDLNLPSSSRPLQAGSEKSDGFDLGQPSGSSGPVHGNSDSQGVFKSYETHVPGAHIVKRGDTLWDITGSYFHNPWMWPKVWSFNSQIQNPHWIYPGDHVRLRLDGGDDRASQTLGLGMNLRHSTVAPDTVFLRDEGFIDDERRDVWGEISGSPEDTMLLTDGDSIYLDIKKDHQPTADQELTIFRPVRGAEGQKGSIVSILGTVRITGYDADKHLAKGKIIESLDVIERGSRVGPIGRRFIVIAPKKNKEDLSAHVAASVYPRVFHGQNQVVFIDKGSDDGLEPGNRLFILRRGDPWRATLKGSGDLSDQTIKTTSGLGPETDSVRGTDHDRDYPDEIVGELRVLRSREKTSTCLVTSSVKEIESGDLAVARKGY